MEKLIFRSPEHAAEFTKHVEHRINQERKPDISNPKEIVSQELAKQFEIEGHGVSLLSHPWEHTKEEHAEVQQLVNVSFMHGLTSAIAQAEKSTSFPRNIDLLHDLLTGEMYDAILRSRIIVQRMPVWIYFAISVFFTLLLTAIFLFIFLV
ncbi:MAG: hypothetical protein O3A36_01150 [bacterium]|nr:hypothetical protein [bacterium]